MLTLILWPTLLAGFSERLCSLAQRGGFQFGLLYPAPKPPPAIPLDLPEPEPFEVEEDEPEPEAPDTPALKPRKRRVRGLRVRQETILRLARARAIPTTNPVPAKWGRPAGLAFSDVSALGVGLKDGDVLTKVAGVPALNRGSVISTVMSVRERRAPTISAEFWRGGERYQLLVEMPYPPPKKAPSNRLYEPPVEE